MQPFQMKNGELHAENFPLSKIAAEFGTPTYVYSKEALTSAFKRFDAGFEGPFSLFCGEI